MKKLVKSTEGVVRDVDGGTLRLTKTSLTELTGYERGPFQLNLNSLRLRIPLGTLTS